MQSFYMRCEEIHDGEIFSELRGPDHAGRPDLACISGMKQWQGATIYMI
jgi:hypothetical protein